MKSALKKVIARLEERRAHPSPAVRMPGLWLAPEFTTMGAWTRVWWLAALVAGGAAVYGVAMLALGFRPRDFREH